MKKGRVLSVICFVLIMVLLLSACASKGMNSATDTSSPEVSSSSYGSSMGYDSLTNEKGDTEAAVAPGEADYGTADSQTENSSDEDINNSAALTTGDLEAQSQEKIIKNYYLDIETQDFDQLITNINDQIKSLGGYVESSSIGGKSFYESNVTRRGSIVARIPTDRADEFVNTVDETANVTNNQSSTKNVTLDYVDTQSKIEALKIEQERLYAILEKAEDLDSVITLESRLSDIRYELENYESQLRVYDNQVQYSTITMEIQEVERITPDTKEKPTFVSRIQNGFSDTLYNISEGFQNFMVWLIVNLPYLLIWGIIIFIIIMVVRRYIRKTGGKKHITAAPFPAGQDSAVQSTVNSQKQENTNPKSGNGPAE